MNAEVKSGYKQTEVGLIPEDWFVTSLGNSFGKITTGKLDANAMSENGEYPFFTCAKEVYRINHYAFDCDALLISGNGANVGYVHHYNGKFNAYQRTYVLTEAKHDIHYLKVYVEVNLQERLRVEVNAGNTPYIVKSTLSDMPIGLPKSSIEQQRIAFTLADIDALISSLDHLISKKRDIQQATMQQLLTGQRRLPGFSGARSRHALRDLVSTPVTDGPHETPRFVENGIPFLSVNNIANNRIDFRDLRFISREDHRIYSKKCRPQRNDLLLGKAASVGKVALIETDIELNIWSPIALIRMSDAHDPRYFYYAFRSKEIGRQIEVLTNSSSQGNIGMGDIERLIFSVPDLAEQNAIATILSDMDTELAVLEARRNKARDIKQGMMQALLTGRIRLV